MDYAVFRTGSLVEDDKLIIELHLCLKPQNLMQIKDDEAEEYEPEARPEHKSKQESKHDSSAVLG